MIEFPHFKSNLFNDGSLASSQQVMYPEMQNPFPNSQITMKHSKSYYSSGLKNDKYPSLQRDFKFQGIHQMKYNDNSQTQKNCTAESLSYESQLEKEKYLQQNMGMIRNNQTVKNSMNEVKIIPQLNYQEYQHPSPPIINWGKIKLFSKRHSEFPANPNEQIHNGNSQQQITPISFKKNQIFVTFESLDRYQEKDQSKKNTDSPIEIQKNQNAFFPVKFQQKMYHTSNSTKHKLLEDDIYVYLSKQILQELQEDCQIQSFDDYDENYFHGEQIEINHQDGQLDQQSDSCTSKVNSRDENSLIISEIDQREDSKRFGNYTNNSLPFRFDRPKELIPKISKNNQSILSKYNRSTHRSKIISTQSSIYRNKQSKVKQCKNVSDSKSAVIQQEEKCFSKLVEEKKESLYLPKKKLVSEKEFSNNDNKKREQVEHNDFISQNKQSSIIKKLKNICTFDQMKCTSSEVDQTQNLQKYCSSTQYKKYIPSHSPYYQQQKGQNFSLSPFRNSNRSPFIRIKPTVKKNPLKIEYFSFNYQKKLQDDLKQQNLINNNNNHIQNDKQSNRYHYIPFFKYLKQKSHDSTQVRQKPIISPEKKQKEINENEYIVKFNEIEKCSLGYQKGITLFESLNQGNNQKSKNNQNESVQQYVQIRNEQDHNLTLQSVREMIKIHSQRLQEEQSIELSKSITFKENKGY